jgi:hypothetical protein
MSVCLFPSALFPRYVVTWKIGCSTFQQHEAKAYCNSMGMEPVSLDSPAKQDNFNRLIAQDAQRYFWTGEQAGGWAALGKPWLHFRVTRLGCSASFQWGLRVGIIGLHMRWPVVEPEV